MSSTLAPHPPELALSLVVPAYQEAHRILETLESIGQALDTSEVTCEVIVVVDGGADATLKISEGFARTHPAFEVIALPDNRGKGAAVKVGVEHARGAVIAFTDADLPFGMPAILDACEALLNDTDIDLVIGDRNDKRSRANQRPPLARRIAGRAYSWLVTSVVQTGITDTQCGLKFFRHDAAKQIFKRTTLNGFGFDVELIHIARQAGMKIHTVPVNLLRHEGSRVQLVGDSLEMFGDLFRIRRNSKRGLYQIPSQEKV